MKIYLINAFIISFPEYCVIVAFLLSLTTRFRSICVRLKQFIAVSPDRSTLSMKTDIIQNKWIIRETSINDSIKLLSSQPAVANVINRRRSKIGFILSFISPLMTSCEHHS